MLRNECVEAKLAVILSYYLFFVCRIWNLPSLSGLPPEACLPTFRSFPGASPTFRSNSKGYPPLSDPLLRLWHLFFCIHIKDMYFALYPFRKQIFYKVYIITGSAHHIFRYRDFNDLLIMSHFRVFLNWFIASHVHMFKDAWCL